MSMPGTETIRFRRPTTGPNAVKPEPPKLDQFGSLAPQGWKRRHQGLLQDQVGRQQPGPMVPSFSLAVRILLLVRTCGAMYSIIADCDEVFNFYEPLHYFMHNAGFQTWEQSPEFAVRSWAYVLLHWPLAFLGPRLLSLGKRQQFFALRIFLGAICSVCEARFMRAVVEAVNERVGRYVFFAMLFSAGMWSASVSFLPSTFAMYATMLAAAEWFHPATSTTTGMRRAYRAVFFVAVGAIVGWPFAAALGLPIIYEQLRLFGGEIVAPADQGVWRIRRLDTLVKAILSASLVAIPVVLVDSWAYGRLTFPTLNIVTYNMFGNGGGPDLYGTSPLSFYFANLFLNFNFLLPLALISLPALAITYKYDFRRLGRTQMKPQVGESSPYSLMIVRLSPFYIWLGILSAQAHKEERFMYPAYPLLCFNAAVSVFLIKGWMETVFIKITKSPYRAGKTSMFSYFALACITIPGVLSVLRFMGQSKFYHAPFDLVYHFEYVTIPNILSDLGFSPVPPPKGYRPKEGQEVVPEWDYAPLAELDPPITLCYGAEWHRFPGSFLVPEGIEVNWIKSDMDGMMPRRWDKSHPSVGGWPLSETRVVHEGRFNGQNRPSAEPGTYVPVEDCAYLVASHMPSQPATKLQPDFIESPEWEREFCETFLDNAASKWWARVVWLPWGLGESGRVYGEYCLLKRK